MVGNELLDALSTGSLASVMAIGRRVRLSAQETLFEQSDRVRTVHFPLTAVLSLTTLLRDGATIGLAVIGKDGTTGVPLLLGTDSMANAACTCEVAGEVIAIPAEQFLEELQRNPELRAVGLRYVALLLTQIGQAVACSRLHHTVHRCASWLLVTRDRVGADRFRVTHGLLAQMLGTRRASVTEALGVLTRADAISTHYGTIEILDRVILESAACECYGVIRMAMERTLISLANVTTA